MPEKKKNLPAEETQEGIVNDSITGIQTENKKEDLYENTIITVFRSIKFKTHSTQAWIERKSYDMDNDSFVDIGIADLNYANHFRMGYPS